MRRCDRALRIDTQRLRIQIQHSSSEPVICAHGQIRRRRNIRISQPKILDLGKDNRDSPDELLATEYCNTTDTACDLDSTCGAGMGRRLNRWSLGSDGRLAVLGGYESTQKVYIMNEKNIQDIALITT